MAGEKNAISSIIAADEIGRDRVPRKRFGDLVSKPFCGGVGRYSDPDDLSPAQSKNDQGEEPLKGQRGNNKEIYSRDTVSVIS